jgi:hypothetical protein
MALTLKSTLAALGAVASMATTGAAFADHGGFLYEDSFSSGFELPSRFYTDRDGMLRGPNGGFVTEADDVLLETVIDRDGEVRVFAFDWAGSAIPVRSLRLDRVTLRIGGRAEVVYLEPAGRYSMIGYFDPYRFSRYSSRGYASFGIAFPSRVIVSKPYGYHWTPRYKAAYPRYGYDAPRRSYYGRTRVEPRVKLQITLPFEIKTRTHYDRRDDHRYDHRR